MKMFYSGNATIDRVPEVLLKERKAKPDVMMTYFEIQKSKAFMMRLKNHKKKKGL